MEYEKVDHPQHYNEHPAGIECIDVIEAFNFNLGSVIKYCWRAGLKPGEETLDDLKKAAWYVQREIERIEQEQNSCPNKETDTVSKTQSEYADYVKGKSYISDDYLIKIRNGELVWDSVTGTWVTPALLAILISMRGLGV